MKYVYGMKLRESGLGCQPDGLLEVLDGNDFKWLKKAYNYYELIIYDRQLNEKEIEDYGLEFICSLNMEEENENNN